MTDTITITREHVDAAVALLQDEHERLTQQIEHEERRFTEKKARFVERGQAAATNNGIGSDFDDMMEQMGLPRRGRTSSFYLRGSLMEQPSRDGMAGGRLSLTSGWATDLDESTLIATPFYASRSLAAAEGEACPCENLIEAASRTVQRHFDGGRAQHGIIVATRWRCDSGDCIHSDVDLSTISTAPAMGTPEMVMLPYVPAT